MKQYYDRWEYYSTISIFLFGFSVLLRKYFFDQQKNYETSAFYFILFVGIISLLSCCTMYYRNPNIMKGVNNDNNNLLVLFISATLFITGIIVKNKAFKLSPNAGYVDVYMEPFKTLLVYFGSIIALSAVFKVKALIGIVIALVGIVIMVLNQ